MRDFIVDSKAEPSKNYGDGWAKALLTVGVIYGIVCFSIFYLLYKFID